MIKRNSFIISNAWICQIIDNKIVPVFGDLEIEHGKISRLLKRSHNDYIEKRTLAMNSVYDAGGRLVTVPLVNFHDHFYSRLAKGLPINKPMDNFQNVLKNLWWDLDKKLSLDMIEASAWMSVIEAIKNGVTYIFDHHSSPGSTDGSLEKIAEVLIENNLRGALCFETTDRNGSALSKSGLEENINFLKNYSGTNLKSLLGLHASFTLSDDTLAEASELVEEYNVGIHIHLCEDKSDRILSKQYTDQLPVKRLAQNRLLNAKSILGHGVYLTENEYFQIAASGSAIVYNPDSNMNNAVGLPVYAKVPVNIPILIGTDGMHANIAKSMKQYFLLLRNQKNSFDDAFRLFIKSYFDQLTFIRRYFEDFPNLFDGSRADFVIWDYIPPTPINESNFWGHFIYGALESNIKSVMQEGKFLMKDFQLVDIDDTEVFKDIFKQGKKLFSLYK
ncbi:MAG: amidohydrolase family protein [Melioribacteraceae bacterium]|nr:amidohydrolase family protein [Melioribacteraceae bacterium]